MKLPAAIGRLCCLFALTTSLAACAEQPPAEVAAQPGPTPTPTATLPRFDKRAYVEIATTKGKVVVELDGTNAPITVGNFLDLVNRRFYDGLTFHRVEPGFVVQGGDPLGNGTGGFIDPKTRKERTIPLEIRPTVGGKPGDILYSKTYQEAGLSPSGQPPVLSHRRGVIAMARSSYPDSASSQFYITLADTSPLDGGYAVFGKVIQGVDVVDRIAIGDKMTSLRVVSAPPVVPSAPSSTP
jgi:cyclophilin family peptidyl-prolyl cis-trans isomerase